MKKIIMILSNSFDPDPRVYKEAKSLSNAGFNVIVLSWDREGSHPEQELINGISIRRVKSKGSYGKGLRSTLAFLFFYIKALKWLLKQKQFALHCHDLDTAVLGMIFYVYKKVAFIYDPHEVNYYPDLNKFLKGMISNLERVAVKLSHATLFVNLNHFNKLRKFRKKNLIEIRNCPELNFFHHPVKDKPNDTITLGWIGQIKDGKGVEKLFPIGRKLNKLTFNVSILLAGKIHPNFRKQFQQLISEYNDLKVDYIGHLPYDVVRKYYHKITISLILSDPIDTYLDSTPTKLYESLASGVPVVCTPIGDTVQLLKKSKGGISVRFDELQDIDQTVLTLVKQPKRLAQMSYNGHSFAKKNLSWEIMARRLYDCYKNIL